MEFFRWVPQARGLGQFLTVLAPGLGRDALAPVAYKYGDLIPTSMTICLAGYSPRIVTFLALKKVRLLICGWATAVLRVGGWSTCFFRNASGIKLGSIPLYLMAKALKVPGGVLPLGAASPRVGSTPDGVLAPGLGPDALAPIA